MPLRRRSRVPCRQPPPPAPPGRRRRPRLSALPPLADAFAALLAAEQGMPGPSAAPHVAGLRGRRAAPVTDELVEQVARRVLERLSDRVVRGRGAELRSCRVAERLVREEIERIKASIT